jgi:hypothetical protein
MRLWTNVFAFGNESHKETKLTESTKEQSSRRKMIVIKPSLFLLLVAGAVQAADQDVTPRIIFGLGNDNGAFTVGMANGIELGIRGKVRYNPVAADGTLCGPLSKYNSNGDGSYSFPAGNCGSNTYPVWSFDWSINSDVGCEATQTTCSPLSAYDYELKLDSDSSYRTNFAVSFDPINPTASFPVWDHSLGTGSTKQGTGSTASSPPNNCEDDDGKWSCSDGRKCNVATDLGGCLKSASLTYAQGISQLTVAQNSWQYRWYVTTIDSNAVGMYTIELYAKSKGTQNVLASTKIVVLVGPLPTEVTQCTDSPGWGSYGVSPKVFLDEEECVAFVQGDLTYLRTSEARCLI